MDITALIESLSRPGAYPHPVDRVEVRQTHISAVFLAGPFAYKVKKPVTFSFLDFSTLDLRRHYCEEEVRLNRRLAGDVYLGVVPVVGSGDRVIVEGAGEPVDWAVKMERLDERQTLRRSLDRGEADPAAIGRRLAAFHRSADRGPRIAEAARLGPVIRNALENYEAAEPLIGQTVSRAVLDRLRERTRRAFERLGDLIERRADLGLPCDGHGDLKIDHVYIRPDRKPPADLIVVDCIEFNERFRHLDPLADLAFLAMDLRAAGHRREADILVDAYRGERRDPEADELLEAYVAYRAAVRGKVEGLATAEAELSDAERAEDLDAARGHWLLALATLEEPAGRPGLVLVGGLPGAGKSTLARGLAKAAGFEVVRSDVVRKELAGLGPDESATAGFGEGIYTPEWTERTYTACLGRADALLFEGRRVVVDASFGRAEHRERFRSLAARRGLPFAMLTCAAAEEVVRGRLAGRSGDVSDADTEVYHRAAASREPIGPSEGGEPIDTAGGPVDALQRALAALGRAGLWS